MNVPPLWTQQIQHLLTTHPLTAPLFRGVYACNELPHPHPTQQGRFVPWNLVVNTDPSTRPGEHWLLLAADTPYQLVVFDSYGLDFVTFYQNPWFKRFAKHFQTSYQNKRRYQGNATNTCGHYCIYVASERGRTSTYAFDDLPNLTPNHYRCNDPWVANIVSTHLDLDDVIRDVPLQKGQRCHAKKST